MNYKPINCSFHDLLLDRATKKAFTKIIYSSELEQKEYRGRILDVYSYNGEEFLKGEDDFEIRLDLIVSLDGVPNL